MAPVLEFKNVSCALGGKSVVDDVSFAIEAGQIICLMGESGCGKTTCLRLAGGIETPSAGEIYLNGNLVSTPQSVVPPEKRGLGFLFQDYALFPHLSVFENVCFGIGDLPKDERTKRANELLRAVDLVGLAERAPATLSGGQQQRIALARALAPYPQLVLMDEPFSGLDAPQRDKMRDLTKELLKENNAAGLIVTHDVADAFRVADLVAVQKEGQILDIGTPEEIYENSDAPEVMHLLGQKLNIITHMGEALCFRSKDVSIHKTRENDIHLFGSPTHKQPTELGFLYRLRVKVLAGGKENFVIEYTSTDNIPINITENFYVPRSRLVLLDKAEAEKERNRK